MSLQGGARLPPRVSQNVSQTLITFTLIKKFHFNCSLDFVNKKWFNSMRYFTCMQLLVIPSRDIFLLPLLNWSVLNIVLVEIGGLFMINVSKGNQKRRFWSHLFLGAGKTTTFSMLTGDLSITEGTAFLDGFNIQTHLKQVRQYSRSNKWGEAAQKRLLCKFFLICIVISNIVQCTDFVLMYWNIVGRSTVEQVKTKTKTKEITVAKSKRAQTIQWIIHEVDEKRGKTPLSESGLILVRFWLDEKVARVLSKPCSVVSQNKSSYQLVSGESIVIVAL